MSRFVKRFLADENGGTAIEYGLIAALLGMGLVLSLTNMQTSLVALFSSVDEVIPERP